MSQNQSAIPASTSLERVLDKNEIIKDTVEQSAAELLVINAVLKQEVPAHVQTGDVAQALQKTDALESRIQSSAEDLAHVNHALKQEIGVRVELERELASAKAELDQVQAQSQGQSHDRSGGQSASH